MMGWPLNVTNLQQLAAMMGLRCWLAHHDLHMMVLHEVLYLIVISYINTCGLRHMPSWEHSCDMKT